jgi:hypothetical protein
MPAKPSSRVFKTAWFNKAAKRARIGDVELCAAIRQVMRGQADDLGGGVFKKRLNDNMHRSIVLAKGELYWVYAYLFAKKDRANISRDELVAFRKLADGYASSTEDQLAVQLRNGDLTEICNGEQGKVQE